MIKKYSKQATFTSSKTGKEKKAARWMQWRTPHLLAEEIFKAKNNVHNVL